MFGGWETVLLLAISLLLFGSRRIPELARGLRRGLEEFTKTTRNFLDEMSFDAGKSLGGIYGKRAAQALTPENHVAELYNPAVFQAGDEHCKFKLSQRGFLKSFWSFVRRMLAQLKTS